MESGTVAPHPRSNSADHLHRWRFDQLRQAGYGQAEAEQLADRLDVDLHDAVDLVRRGCPPETALRILL